MRMRWRWDGRDDRDSGAKEKGFEGCHFVFFLWFLIIQ